MYQKHFSHRQTAPWVLFLLMLFFAAVPIVIFVFSGDADLALNVLDGMFSDSPEMLLYCSALLALCAGLMCYASRARLVIDGTTLSVCSRLLPQSIATSIRLDWSVRLDEITDATLYSGRGVILQLRRADWRAFTLDPLAWFPEGERPPSILGRFRLEPYTSEELAALARSNTLLRALASAGLNIRVPESDG